ncbi:MAG: AraC family transcriptional regulator [Dorea sp.]|jgi:AraC-like DNA-binding protein|nr:AraC family transcriptional regulator [Dorea sp.]
MTYIRTKLQEDLKIDSIITLHYFEYMKDFIFQGEAHDFWEFLYVDNGTVSVRYDDTWMTLNTGDIIFHQPNEFHAIKSIGRNSPNLVVISFICHSPAMKHFIHKSYTLTNEERSLISHIISEGKKTFSTPMNIPSVEQVQIKDKTPFASQQLIILYLELFLITCIRNHQENTAPSFAAPKNTPEKQTTKQSRLEEVIQFMEAHICEQLKLSDICSEFSISRSSLQSLFHSEKDCGVIDYFNQMKIQRAKDIIREGTMNFTEIAYYLSYSSLPYFSRQFKAALGMSPSEYSSSVKGITDALKGNRKDT